MQNTSTVSFLIRKYRLSDLQKQYLNSFLIKSTLENKNLLLLEYFSLPAWALNLSLLGLVKKYFNTDNQEKK